MVRAPRLLALTLFLCLAHGAGATPPPAPSPAAKPAATEDGKKNDLLSNTIPGHVDEIAKPSVRQILERQRSAGEGIGSAVSAENYARLEKLYAAQQYDAIGNYLSRFMGDSTADDWVRRKANDGNVPMMWLLADRYAGVQTVDLAVKWGYTALLGTMQERAVCLDGDTEFAAVKISAQHPRLIALDHSNPFLSKEAKLFAMSVLTNATQYADPIPWLCKPFSSRGRSQSAAALYAYDAIYFPHLRAKARNALRKKYQIAQPPEALPPLPKPPKPAP